jgi:hypothetical protein
VVSMRCTPLCRRVGVVQLLKASVTRIANAGFMRFEIWVSFTHWIVSAS